MCNPKLRKNHVPAALARHIERTTMPSGILTTATLKPLKSPLTKIRNGAIAFCLFPGSFVGLGIVFKAVYEFLVHLFGIPHSH